MADIKLFVCCHQPTEVPKHPLLVPIQVGAALADSHFSGFFHDDTGDNISAKNRSYCELTAQYWAWKNIDVDYYGFFHYRRYLYPDISVKWPYQIEGKSTQELLNKLDYGRFADLIQQYDLILPKGENMYIPVREHYANAPNHHRKDLELIEQIIREKHPEMTKAMEKYLSGTICFFGNIFIMRYKVFHHFCEWLFPLLREFDKRADISEYSVPERRVDGYLAERLLGVYATHRRDELKTLELPRVHFYGNGRVYMQRKAINTFFPPGTLRRKLMKELCDRKFRSRPNTCQDPNGGNLGR